MEQEEVELFIAEAPDAPGVHPQLKAVLEAVIYITDEPLSLAQMATALGQPVELVKTALLELTADYAVEDRGITIREVAGGYKIRSIRSVI